MKWLVPAISAPRLSYPYSVKLVIMGSSFLRCRLFLSFRRTSLQQDHFSQACGHRQDRAFSTCVATQSTGEHHFSVRQRSVFQFIGWSLAQCEQLTEGQGPCTLAFTASQSYACREVAE